MKKLALTNFSLRFPWLVMIAVAVMVAVAASRFPNVKFDNDPENMLSEDEAVRVTHHKVKEKFDLYDFVIVGIVNEEHPDGVFNVETLQRIDRLTQQLLSLRKGENGRPEVIIGHGSRSYRTLDLRPESSFERILSVAFRHDANNLFRQDGSSAIISREIISPSVVDNIKQDELGSLKLEYLMENVPSTREEALEIRRDAMSNPLYHGTVVSGNGKAIALYVPITEKTYSYNVANLVRELTADWGGKDLVYITGLPVAEDTFGVEMLVQMATSAPMAGLAIFILLLFFFKRFTLVLAPMIVAIVSVVATMGLLIGLGLDVHIMSSMIAIFLMPIAVADAVHILSEFFDVYHQFEDKKRALQNVIGHLFMPMLYTSLTTMAGFASLGMTPIPPVRVFGLHVAFGVGLAWLLTMTFVPAFISIFISNKAMHRLCRRPDQSEGCEFRNGWLDRFLRYLGGMTYRRAKVILMFAAVVIVFSIYGLTRIRVNDNPVKWFTEKHPVRVADRVLNDHFGGTYTAYLTFYSDPNAAYTCREIAARMRRRAADRFGEPMPQALDRFLEGIDRLEKSLCNVQTCEPLRCFKKLANFAHELDGEALSSWNAMADEINYMKADQLTLSSLESRLGALDGVNDTDLRKLIDSLGGKEALKGEELREEALKICDSYTDLSFERFVFDLRTELTAPPFKRPDVLGYLEELQSHVNSMPVVGKTSSVLDALKKARYELKYVAPSKDYGMELTEKINERNNDNFAVPESAAEAGQIYIQLEGMKKKNTLFHLVTRDYREANMWVQLTSGDNRDMQSVVDSVNEYTAEHKPPIDMDINWAGLTYINVVWQDKMVRGMFSSLISSFLVVLVMMMVLFRSPLYGILSMAPLTLTILFIYGLIGWIGKDYDMPVAVLSSLTLGLSVDFAIHFLKRAREEHKRFGTWAKTCGPMFREPATAISRNAIVISIGFTPLLFAPLVPYKTVGFFLATIMAASWMATLFVLPALLTVLRRWAFKENEKDTRKGGEK